MRRAVKIGSPVQVFMQRFLKGFDLIGMTKIDVVKDGVDDICKSSKRRCWYFG